MNMVACMPWKLLYIMDSDGILPNTLSRMEVSSTTSRVSSIPHLILEMITQAGKLITCTACAMFPFNID